MFTLENLDILHNKPLALFLKSNRLHYTGNTDKLVERIKDAISEEKITMTEYKKWREGLLKEGRKHIYIFSINDRTITELKNAEHFSELRIEKQLNVNNEIETINLPEEPTLLYCKETIVNNSIENISLAYVEKKRTYIPNFQARQIDVNDINFYTFIDIDLSACILMIRIDPTDGLRETGDGDTNDENTSSAKIAQKYADNISNTFGFEIYDNREEFQDVLKKIWESTLIKLPEIEEKINSINEFTEAYINQCVDKLDIEIENPDEILNRVHNYWEKVLLNQPFDEIDIQQNDIGYVTKEKIRGLGGQKLTYSVKQDTPIHMADYHYDIKAAVDNQGNLTYLRFNWNGLEGIDKDIRTIMEATSGFFRVIFTKYSVEEEIQHVLSGIKRFKNEI